MFPSNGDWQYRIQHKILSILKVSRNEWIVSFKWKFTSHSTDDKQFSPLGKFLNHSKRYKWVKISIQYCVYRDDAPCPCDIRSYSVSTGPQTFWATPFLPYMMSYLKSEHFGEISTSVDLFWCMSYHDSRTVDVVYLKPKFAIQKSSPFFWV